jgi:hypothetical protein
VIRQLGEATGGPVDSGIKKSLAVMVFVLVLVLWSILMLVGRRALAAWRASAVIEATLAPAAPGPWERLGQRLGRATEPPAQLDAPAKAGAAATAANAPSASRESKAFTKPTRPTKVARASKARTVGKAGAPGKANGSVANGSVAALDGADAEAAAPRPGKHDTANGTHTEVARASFRRYISRPEEERTG